MSAQDPSAPGLPIIGAVAATAAAVAAVLVAAFALLTPAEKAATLGLTRHGELVVAVDGGAADVVGVTGITPGTPAQVLTLSDAGVPTWRAPAASTPTTTRGDMIRRGASADERVALGAVGTVLTSDGTDPVWSAPSGPTILYADDGTAENGDETASITGTGASSSITLTASADARNYGTPGATAARVVFPLPAGVREIEVELQVTAISGYTTGGARYLGACLRNAADGGAPAYLWGAAWNDNNAVFYGNLVGNLNGGTSVGVSPAINAVDRWERIVLRPRDPFLTLMAGSGTAGARPVTWAPVVTPAPLITSASVPAIVDTGSATALAIILQSFGGGGATSITIVPTIRVVTW